MNDEHDEDIARRLHELPRAIEPPRDLWPGIAPRLAPRRRGLPRWLPLAAAVAVALGGGALLWRARAVTPPSAPVATHDEGSARELLAELEREPGTLAPETLAALRRNLAVIDSAIAESRHALERDAEDAAAERWLRVVERQRLDLLRQVVRLPRS